MSFAVLVGAVVCFWTWYDRTYTVNAISMQSVGVTNESLQRDPIESDDIAAQSIVSDNDNIPCIARIDHTVNCGSPSEHGRSARESPQLY